MTGIGVTLDVTGFKRVERLKRGTGVTFTRFAPKVARAAFMTHRAGFQKDLEVYAPRRKGSPYVRTFRLRKGWKVKGKAQGNGYKVDTTNRTPYTHWVVGRSNMKSRAAAKASQAKIHQDRWWLVADKSKFWFDKIINTYKENYFKVLEDQAGVKVTRRSRAFKSR